MNACSRGFARAQASVLVHALADMYEHMLLFIFASCACAKKNKCQGRYCVKGICSFRAKAYLVSHCVKTDKLRRYVRKRTYAFAHSYLPLGLQICKPLRVCVFAQICKHMCFSLIASGCEPVLHACASFSAYARVLVSMPLSVCVSVRERACVSVRACERA
eukprot:1374735-Pleurochrysis_carterae.AAC.1